MMRMTTAALAVADGDDASISQLQAIADQAFAGMLAEVAKAHIEPPPNAD